MKKVNQKSAERQGAHSPTNPKHEELRRDLFALIVSAGAESIRELLEGERDAFCGPRYVHDAARRASRAGHVDGELVIGGRRLSLRRPRVRDVDGHEVRLPAWEEFSATDALSKRAVEQMVIGVSTRKYKRSLESVDVETRGDSKSAVSRRFVALTSSKLASMMESDLSKFALAVLMIDGIYIGDHVVLVALGIDIDGNKRVLCIWEGATENTIACKALLENLAGRKLPMTQRILAVIDGSKALHKAIEDVFGNNVIIQRCQVHKQRNVLGHLPDAMHAHVRRLMQQAYRTKSASTARRQLENLARTLDAKHPSAAASLREGLDETLTIKRLKLSALLAKSLSTTNMLESVQGGIRRICRRVTTWRGGTMILRWVGAAVVEHSRGFKRVKGHGDIKALVAQLRNLDARQEVAGHQKAA